MKILSAQQIRDGDAYTIVHEPISSMDLMERASAGCVGWIRDHYPVTLPIYIFCGMGNNGGDGLAITRLLHEGGYEVHAYILFHGEKFSPDGEINRLRVEHLFGSRLYAIHGEGDFPEIPADALVIDALFGTGLNRPLQGMSAKLVEWINAQGLPLVAIDMPSGLMADNSSAGLPVIKATHTLSFEFYKLAFLMPENNGYTGEVHVLPIGISKAYTFQTKTPYHLTDENHIHDILKARGLFSHKGTYGHALLIAGSYGKMGAAVMSARACTRSGVGLLTCHIPSCGYDILQTTVPEAMCRCDTSRECWQQRVEEAENYAAIGVGPGIGQHPQTARALDELLSMVEKPMVLDADALNILAAEKGLLDKIPARSLLTPHPREFERLFAKTGNNFERLDLQRQVSRRYRIYLIVKGHFTSISTPEGMVFFNPTGNPGMATGGSGDVLTGILTGMLAQGYEPLQAALLGVYLHGLAGDLAADELSAQAMIAPDIISYLGKAFKSL